MVGNTVWGAPGFRVQEEEEQERGGPGTQECPRAQKSAAERAGDQEVRPPLRSARLLLLALLSPPRPAPLPAPAPQIGRGPAARRPLSPCPTMPADLSGTWNLLSSDNFDGYMLALGRTGGAAPPALAVPRPPDPRPATPTPSSGLRTPTPPPSLRLRVLWSP